MTTAQPVPSTDALHRFRISDPTFVTETSLANVWRVKRHDGTVAALKVYHRDMDDEAAGFDLLRHWNGCGAAKLYAMAETAALLEWLDGPSLGDMVRTGQDDAASQHLVQVAQTLHQSKKPHSPPLPTLADRFAPLFTARFSLDAPAETRATLTRATALAKRLLAESHDPIPLHGDLHHDNIKGSPRGYLAFDAKGGIGNRLFELANAFRNPLGSKHIYADPAIIKRRASIWANGFGTTERDLLNWAAAQSALSICWTAKGQFSTDHAADVQLIDTFFQIIDAAA